MWFRIELHKDGSVASCAEVEGSFADTKTVHYVEADSKEQAIKILKNRWEARRLKSLEYVRASNARRQAAGLCISCGSEKEPERKDVRLCAACKDRNHKNRGKGVQHAKTDEEKAAREIARAEKKKIAKKRDRARFGSRRVYERHRAYRTMLAKFDSMTPRAFREWLVAEIERIESKGRDGSAQTGG